MANENPSTTSTAAKVAIGTGVAAIFGGILASLGGSKKPTPSKPLGKCGRCGR